jgi:dihydrofolate reductase
MRKIVAELFVSVDGVIEAPENWAPDLLDEQIKQEIGSATAAADTLLLGRVTYQTFAKAFTGAKQDDPFGIQMTNMPKYVVSATLDRVDWKNSTLITGDVAEQIAKLKEPTGKDISVSGSPTLVQWLMREGLLDELWLLLFPLVVGTGRRLFDDDGDQLPLKLAECKNYRTGVASLRYEKPAA